MFNENHQNMSYDLKKSIQIISRLFPEQDSDADIT